VTLPVIVDAGAMKAPVEIREVAVVGILQEIFSGTMTDKGHARMVM